MSPDGSSVWAKSDRDKSGALAGWLPLHQHLDDTRSVAELLWDQWLSPQVVARLGTEFPDGAAGARVAACWLAALHDVGKASPAFACRVDELAEPMRDAGLAMHLRLRRDPDRHAVNHALVGHVAVREWLADEAGFDFLVGAAQWASVVGSHHGVTPEDSQLALVNASPQLAGTGRWAQVRHEHLAHAAEQVGGVEAPRRYRAVELSVAALSLLTAIVIVADWIASNPDLFPLFPPPTGAKLPAPDSARTLQRAKKAWAALDLPPG
jgi:CRISPR-associated endonuclease Cas3-HD